MKNCEEVNRGCLVMTKCPQCNNDIEGLESCNKCGFVLVVVMFLHQFEKKKKKLGVCFFEKNI